jgi:hypothetical protein
MPQHVSKIARLSFKHSLVDSEGVFSILSSYDSDFGEIFCRAKVVAGVYQNDGSSQ